MDAQVLEPRTQRGIALAKTKATAIKAIVGDKYLVPSATHSGATYVVDVSAGSCTCPDWESFSISGQPHHRCKHLIATLVVRREFPLPDGNSVVIEEKRYYPRDWHATNRARTEIPRLGPALLADLVGGLGLQPPIGGVRGRPRVPEADILLAASLRAFEDMTAGAAVVAAENYRDLGLINMERIPSYNTLLREFAKPKYMPYLHRLVAGSAAPLLPLETVYAIDGTGLGTSVYSHYFLKKHGPKSKQREESPHHHWVQANLVFGTTTHVIVAAQVTEVVSECQLMPTLLKRAVGNGAQVHEWLADAAC